MFTWRLGARIVSLSGDAAEACPGRQATAPAAAATDAVNLRRFIPVAGCSWFVFVLMFAREARMGMEVRATTHQRSRYFKNVAEGRCVRFRTNSAGAEAGETGWISGRILGLAGAG